jgi:hypothetical protein
LAAKVLAKKAVAPAKPKPIRPVARPTAR